MPVLWRDPKERRVPGRKSLTNVVRIIARGWLAWLKLTTGCKSFRPTDTQDSSSAPFRPWERRKREFERVNARVVPGKRFGRAI
jgi:hypothetical protein